MSKVYAAVTTGVLEAGRKLRSKTRSRKGMELVQVGILIAIAVGLGIIFKDKIGQFVNETFNALLGAKFS
ncbi:MAG: hypothetical protein SOV71_01885 [Anaerovoracaceae bacterium]|nr:hypothetical protein [Bacillota bacterium]MDY2670291.1 hypothetical protein [Anaerovoracaceae bacterium]